MTTLLEMELGHDGAPLHQIRSAFMSIQVVDGICFYARSEDTGIATLFLIDFKRQTG